MGTVAVECAGFLTTSGSCVGVSTSTAVLTNVWDLCDCDSSATSRGVGRVVD